MRQLLIVCLCCVSVACTTVVKTNEVHSTLGQARIVECDKIVYPNGIGEDKEAIGYGCTRYESDGLSAEFGAVIALITGWIPWPW